MDEDTFGIDELPLRKSLWRGRPKPKTLKENVRLRSIGGNANCLFDQERIQAIKEGRWLYDPNLIREMNSVGHRLANVTSYYERNVTKHEMDHLGPGEDYDCYAENDAMNNAEVACLMEDLEDYLELMVLFQDKIEELHYYHRYIPKGKRTSTCDSYTNGVLTLWSSLSRPFRHLFDLPRIAKETFSRRWISKPDRNEKDYVELPFSLKASWRQKLFLAAFDMILNLADDVTDLFLTVTVLAVSTEFYSLFVVAVATYVMLGLTRIRLGLQFRHSVGKSLRKYFLYIFLMSLMLLEPKFGSELFLEQFKDAAWLKQTIVGQASWGARKDPISAKARESAKRIYVNVTLTFAIILKDVCFFIIEAIIFSTQMDFFFAIALTTTILRLIRQTTELSLTLPELHRLKSIHDNRFLAFDSKFGSKEGRDDTSSSFLPIRGTVQRFFAGWLGSKLFACATCMDPTQLRQDDVHRERIEASATDMSGKIMAWVTKNNYNTFIDNFELNLEPVLVQPGTNYNRIFESDSYYVAKFKKKWWGLTHREGCLRTFHKYMKALRPCFCVFNWIRGLFGEIWLYLVDGLDGEPFSWYFARRYPIKTFNSVRRVQLSNCTVTSEALESLCKKCRMISHVNLSFCSNLTDEALINMTKHLFHLEEVVLDSCMLISDRGIYELARLSRHNLRRICLRNMPLISDESLQALAYYCPRLESIDLDRDPTIMCALATLNEPNGDLRERLEESRRKSKDFFIQVRHNERSLRKDRIQAVKEKAEQRKDGKTKNAEQRKDGKTKNAERRKAAGPNTSHPKENFEFGTITDDGIVSLLSKCGPSLTSLSLDYVTEHGGRFTEKYLVAMLEFLNPYCVHLSLKGHKQVTDDVVSLIGTRCRRGLEQLYLTETAISMTALKDSLIHLPNLQYLECSGCEKLCDIDQTIVEDMFGPSSSVRFENNLATIQITNRLLEEFLDENHDFGPELFKALAETLKEIQKRIAAEDFGIKEGNGTGNGYPTSDIYVEDLDIMTFAINFFKTNRHQRNSNLAKQEHGLKKKELWRNLLKNDPHNEKTFFLFRLNQHLKMMEKHNGRVEKTKRFEFFKEGIKDWILMQKEPESNGKHRTVFGELKPRISKRIINIWYDQILRYDDFLFDILRVSFGIPSFNLISTNQVNLQIDFDAGLYTVLNEKQLPLHHDECCRCGDNVLTGRLSPLSWITIKEKPDVPPDARYYCFAQPAQDACKSFKYGDHTSRRMIWKRLLHFGGFLYFNEDLEFIQLSAMAQGPNFSFAGPYRLGTYSASHLAFKANKEERWFNCTIPKLQNMQVAWIFPNEKTISKDAIGVNRHGGFAFRLNPNKEMVQSFFAKWNRLDEDDDEEDGGEVEEKSGAKIAASSIQALSPIKGETIEPQSDSDQESQGTDLESQISAPDATIGRLSEKQLQNLTNFVNDNAMFFALQAETKASWEDRSNK